MGISGADHCQRRLRGNPASRSWRPGVKPIADILSKHRATLKSQFDAFEGYVLEAEKQGVEHYPLYKWTKVTIEDPAKKAKHLKSFTFYVEGEEVYAKAKADALEADLLSLVGGGVITKVSKHDTNPRTTLRRRRIFSERGDRFSERGGRAALLRFLLDLACSIKGVDPLVNRVGGARLRLE